jgi:hypothetical protein
MSFIVMITFDLNGADNTDYRFVKTALDKIDLSQFLMGRTKEVRLPHNTYVAKFSNEAFSESVALRDYLRPEIRRIFRARNLRGKYFIGVGKDWAWKVGHVKQGATGALLQALRCGPRRIAFYRKWVMSSVCWANPLQVFSIATVSP